MTLKAKGTGELEGSSKATVTISKLRRIAASMRLVDIFLKGLVKRWTSRTPNAAKLIRN